VHTKLTHTQSVVTSIRLVLPAALRLRRVVEFHTWADLRPQQPHELGNIGIILCQLHAS
jgi:hypothetical protein